MEETRRKWGEGASLWHLLFKKKKYTRRGGGACGGRYVCELITGALKAALFLALWVSPLSGDAPASPAAISRPEALAGPGRGSCSATQ